MYVYITFKYTHNSIIAVISTNAPAFHTHERTNAKRFTLSFKRSERFNRYTLLELTKKKHDLVNSTNMMR